MIKNATPLSYDLGLLLIRLMLGAVFLFHGAQKLFGMFGGTDGEGAGLSGFALYMESLSLPMPMPMAAATCAALAEFGGGLALVTGMFMRPVVITTVFTMLVAAFVAHDWSFDDMQVPLTLAIVTAGLFFTGTGRIALPTPKLRLPRRDKKED